MWDFLASLNTHMETIAGITVGLAGAWRYVVKPAWASMKRMETTMTNVERVIGSNGGSTLFEQVEYVKDAIQIQASLADVIDRPSVFFSPDGEVESVNVAFTERTGTSLESLRRGGWRQLFGRDDQDDWDEIVERQSVFSRTVSLGGHAFSVIAKPVFNGKKFLGWRAVLTPQG